MSERWYTLYSLTVSLWENWVSCQFYGSDRRFIQPKKDNASKVLCVDVLNSSGKVLCPSSVLSLCFFRENPNLRNLPQNHQLLYYGALSLVNTWHTAWRQERRRGFLGTSLQTGQFILWRQMFVLYWIWKWTVFTMRVRQIFQSLLIHYHWVFSLFTLFSITKPEVWAIIPESLSTCRLFTRMHRHQCPEARFCQP